MTNDQVTNSHLNISEDIVPLWCKVVLHESFLTATVPEVEHQVAKKPKNKESPKESKAGFVEIEKSTKYDTWHDCAQHQLWPQVFLYPERCSWQRWSTWKREYQAYIFFSGLVYFTSCWFSQILTFPWAKLFYCSWLICNELLADYSRNLLAWGPVGRCISDSGLVVVTK